MVMDGPTPTTVMVTVDSTCAKTSSNTSTSSSTIPTTSSISLRVREPTPLADVGSGLDYLDVDDLNEEEQQSSSQLPYPHISRRERSHSTFANPYLTSSASELAAFPGISNTGHATSSNLQTTTSGNNESKIKRRSVSTCAPLSVSPPNKSLKQSSEEPKLIVPNDAEMSNNESSSSSTVSSTSSAATTLTKPPLYGSVRMRESRHLHHHHPRHNPHVRFSSNIEDRSSSLSSQSFRYPSSSSSDTPSVTITFTASSANSAAGASRDGTTGSGSSVVTRRGSSVGPGNRCHHMITEESGAANIGADGSELSPDGESASSPGKVVQRTQSNPEMECCPVCLARKECEILLKRTYSKVNQT